jgi:hypothetical protein
MIKHYPSIDDICELTEAGFIITGNKTRGYKAVSPDGFETWHSFNLTCIVEICYEYEKLIIANIAYMDNLRASHNNEKLQ